MQPDIINLRYLKLCILFNRLRLKYQRYSHSDWGLENLSLWQKLTSFLICNQFSFAFECHGHTKVTNEYRQQGQDMKLKDFISFKGITEEQ